MHHLNRHKPHRVDFHLVQAATKLPIQGLHLFHLVRNNNKVNLHQTLVDFNSTLLHHSNQVLLRSLVSDRQPHLPPLLRTQCSVLAVEVNLKLVKLVDAS